MEKWNCVHLLIAVICMLAWMGCAAPPAAAGPPSILDNVREQAQAIHVKIHGRVQAFKLAAFRSHFKTAPPLVRNVRGYTATSTPTTRVWILAGKDQNQETEGSCIGHGSGHTANHDYAAGGAAAPPILHDYMREIYFEAQRLDAWPGGAYPGARPTYEGSTLEAGVAAMTRLGWCSGADWAFTVADLAYGVSHIGPAVVASQWYESMSEPDAAGWITVSGAVAGGHCYCVYGVVYDPAAPGGGYFLILNSWGQEWGNNGTAKISFTESAKIWRGLNPYGAAVDGEAAFLRNRGQPTNWDGTLPPSAAVDVPWWKWIFGGGKAVAK